MRTRMIIPKKILGLKALKHFVDRMCDRRISITDVEQILNNPEYKRKEPWKDRIVFQGTTNRGFVTLIVSSSGKSLKTCWVN